jgi:hypothetical protein
MNGNPRRRLTRGSSTYSDDSTTAKDNTTAAATANAASMSDVPNSGRGKYPVSSLLRPLKRAAGGLADRAIFQNQSRQSLRLQVRLLLHD